MIHFSCDQIPMPTLNTAQVERWIRSVAADYGFSVGELNYIFCNDDKILAVNREFLQHDYYTDIITFDYTTRSRVNGDIYISLDTVHELHRIIIHGLLHLTGQGDKTPETKVEMTAKEDSALKKIPHLLQE